MSGFDGSDGCEEVADALVDALVLDRVQAFGVTEIRAAFSQDDGIWRVRMRSLVGSATWNLLPPVLQLIEPSAGECAKEAELARMIAAALRR